MKTKGVKKSKKPTIESIMNDTYTGDDVKRYIGVVTENFQDKVSAVAEQFLGLNDKIDRLDSKLSDKIDDVEYKLTVRLDGVEQKLNGVEQKLNGVEQRLDGVEQRLDTHTEMVGRIMIDVEDIKTGMHEKVSRQEFNKLETRLVSLESFVFSGRNKNASKVTK
jgi:chromosome segregation ATPase